MATATSEPEISINTEQTAEEIQKTTTQEHKNVPCEDVNTTVPPNTMSEEVAGMSTTIAPSTISNVVPSESSTTKVPPMVFTETTPSESQENQDQTVVGVSTTMTQNTDSNVVINESNKTHGIEMVFTATTATQESQDDVVGMSATVTQNTDLNVVLSESNKTHGGEMVFTKTATQESREDVVMTQNTVSNVVLDEANKPDGGEMVFTVVAMENNIGDLMQINPDNLPKEVQLSLVQPPPPDDSNFTSTNSGRLSDINQLAIIAASIEENPKDPRSTSSQDKQDSSEKSIKGRVLCTVCDQDFSDLPSMRRHRLIHSDDKPYQCDFCDKSFRRKDNLREHRNIHTQENIYKCERCGKSFPRKYTHKVHMSRFCGKPGQETSESETWTDVNKATNAKPSMVASKTSEPCQLCFKTFRDASTLKRHLLTHSDERPYKCTECDKAFRRKDHLQEHVIVHKLVRPFSCQTCGKSFSRKNGLKTHMIRTTHLIGFDDIILPGQPKGSGDVVEQVLAADQLVATASAVFPREDSQGNDEVETVCQTTSGQDISETNLQPSDSDPRTVAVEFSQVPTNSEEETETTVVLSEKRAEETDVANPECGGTPDETSTQDSGVVKAFLCPTCGVTFPGKEELWKHLQEHLEENMFACRHCFEVLASAELLEEHQKSCDGGEDESAIRNDGDSQVSEGEGSVDQTADATIEEDESLGDETQLTTTPNSKKRKRVGTPERADQTCTICNKVFRDATALKRHSLVHSGERPHACTNCEKRFRRRDHLKAHEIAHHSGITSHECKTCDAAFNTRYALTVHAKTCKNRPSSPKEISEEVKLIGSPESKECPICHKVFKDPSTQRRHFRIHSDERPFHCEVCSKSFRRKDNLKEHLLCHSDEKPFSCNHCGKSLSRRSSLTNHMNVCPARKGVGAVPMAGATTENPVIPDMQFAEPAVQDMCVGGDPQEISAAHLLATGLTSSVVTSSDMGTLDVSSSEMTSSEVAPMEEDIEHGLRDEDDGSGNSFPCEECGKIFRAKWTLKFHQRIHTGEKPYTCTTCDRQFRQASHLKIHERTHSGERPYHCQICGRAFIDSSTMKRHERLHKDAADPNAVIDEQHDVISTEDDVSSQDDVIKGQEYVIANQVISDPNEASVVQQAVEVSIADEGAIQLLVTTASELANSAQPISTNTVAGMNQSGTRLDENNLGQILRECIRNQGVEKIATLEDWQQNHPNEDVGQLIYIQTEEPAETE